MGYYSNTAGTMYIDGVSIGSIEQFEIGTQPKDFILGELSRPNDMTFEFTRDGVFLDGKNLEEIFPWAYTETVSWKDNELKKIDRKIDRVIFNDPATIIIWKDGTKTVVKAQDEKFDKEKGLLMAIMKYLNNNESNFNNIIKKYCGEE